MMDILHTLELYQLSFLHLSSCIAYDSYALWRSRCSSGQERWGFDRKKFCIALLLVDCRRAMLAMDHLAPRNARSTRACHIGHA